MTEGVVRSNNTVRRPRGPEAPLVEALLLHLERMGFSGAPRFLGVDVRGRQVLSWVEGEVAGRPWPEWVADEKRVASVAQLVRAYDDAAQSFGVPAVAHVRRRPDPPGTPPHVAQGDLFIGHQDVTPENVVFVDGRAAALIDFDFAQPCNRAQEVANILLWWAPLMPRVDRETVLEDVDAVARSALIVNAYGLDLAGRAALVETAVNTADRAWHLMRERAERLGGGWRRMWRAGLGDRILRRQVWLADHAAALHAAVLPQRNSR